MSQRTSFSSSLRVRLLARVGLIALLTGLLFSGIQLYLDYRYEIKTVHEDAHEIIATSFKAASYAAWHLDSDAAEDLLSGLLKHRIVSAAELLDEKNEIIAKVENSNLEERHNFGRMLFGGKVTVAKDLIDERARRLPTQTGKIGVLRLIIDPGQVAHDFILRSARVLIGDLLGVSLLVALLLSVFNLTLTQPLLSLGSQLRTIDPQKPGAGKVDVPKGHEANELGILIQDLNALLASVQTNILHRQKAEKELTDLNRTLEDKIEERTSDLRLALEELHEIHEQLKQSQSTILQQDKMASIGQLAAGVAHEINNPMGFITSNLGTLNRYREKIFEYLQTLETAMEQNANEEILAEIKQLRKKLKIEILSEDIEDLLSESQEGAMRVKEIVQNLKGFSRLDQANKDNVNINECLDKTLNIAINEIKYKATVEKDYSELPLLNCFSQQLNQVFLNLIINAAHSITGAKGLIKIITRHEGEKILVSIVDNGCGIPEENIPHLFEPFFTTKEVGKGTGLGLSIAYDIVQKHNGELLVESKADQGTTFTVSLPVHNGA